VKGSKRFFLKKEAKTSIHLSQASPAREQSQTNRSFLVLFSKKNRLLPVPEASYLRRNARPAAQSR
jgi:hypothetical protein